MSSIAKQIYTVNISTYSTRISPLDDEIPYYPFRVIKNLQISSNIYNMPDMEMFLVQSYCSWRPRLWIQHRVQRAHGEQRVDLLRPRWDQGDFRHPWHILALGFHIDSTEVPWGLCFWMYELFGTFLAMWDLQERMDIIEMSTKDACGELSCVWNWQSGKPAVANWLLASENQSTCLGAVALSNAWWFMGSSNRQTIDMVQFPFNGGNPLAMFLTSQFQHNSAQAKTI